MLHNLTHNVERVRVNSYRYCANTQYSTGLRWKISIDPLVDCAGKSTSV